MIKLQLDNNKLVEFEFTKEQIDYLKKENLVGFFKSHVNNWYKYDEWLNK